MMMTMTIDVMIVGGYVDSISGKEEKKRQRNEILYICMYIGLD